MEKEQCSWKILFLVVAFDNTVACVSRHERIPMWTWGRAALALWAACVLGMASESHRLWVYPRTSLCWCSPPSNSIADNEQILVTALPPSHCMTGDCTGPDEIGLRRPLCSEPLSPSAYGAVRQRYWDSLRIDSRQNLPRSVSQVLFAEASWWSAAAPFLGSIL